MCIFNVIDTSGATLFTVEADNLAEATMVACYDERAPWEGAQVVQAGA